MLETAKSMRFDTRQVRATLDGTMTEVRMPIKPQPKVYNGQIFSFIDEASCQYQPGDIVYIKETWNYYKYNNDYDKKYLSGYYYKASPELVEDMPPLVKGYYGVRWFPSIHMPRSAARIFLRVTSRGVERLQDITEEGARAEGIGWLDDACYANNGWTPTFYDPDSGGSPVFRDGFAASWDSIYKSRGYGWDLNPWVTVTKFERLEN